MGFFEYIQKNGIFDIGSGINYPASDVQILLSLLIDLRKETVVSLPRQCGKTSLINTYIKYLGECTDCTVAICSMHSYYTRLLRYLSPTLTVVNGNDVRGMNHDVLIVDEEKASGTIEVPIETYSTCKKLVKLYTPMYYIDPTYLNLSVVLACTYFIHPQWCHDEKRK